MAKTLEHIRESFPEAEQISDNELRQKVFKTWLAAWQASHYDRIEDTPFMRGTLQEINNVQHTRAVTAMSIQFAKTMKEFFDIQLNMDYLIAGAILHDVGKLFQYCEIPSKLGQLFNHCLSAMYIAAREDLPLEVIHIIGMHSLEGDLTKRTPEAAIVHYMDFASADVSLRAKTDTGLGERLKYQVIQKSHPS
jgi:putative nucleotidyltransferase with HDIG domain